MSLRRLGGPKETSRQSKVRNMYLSLLCANMHGPCTQRNKIYTALTISDIADEQSKEFGVNEYVHPISA